MRISVYRHIGKVWYDSLEEIVEEFTTGDNVYVNVYNGRKENRLGAYIGGVVAYNVRYRDLLRKEGYDALLSVLFKEAPALRGEACAIGCLESDLERRGPLGDYDIQCLSVNDSFTVHGRVYDGLDDVCENTEWYLRRRGEPFPAGGHHHRPGDVHVLCNYEPYPIFDSSDWGDDRTYRNYFFKNGQFKPADFTKISDIGDDGNFCKAHERLRCVDAIPLLYYPGDRNTMLLVTSRHVLF